jgi:alkanesulfonate monooxygenase SsuD/methylene tetrahydromethanopterin reductase-like flavin-dependent oxidoreductase (luciferase family)
MKLRFGLFVDFRNPPPWRQPFEKLFPAIVEYIAWAENLGFEYVWLAEHHFGDDGYAPSPMILAATIAQRTREIRISQAVALLPLYHPVRLAEDGALIDIFSGGRFDLGVGLGWRPEEFAAYQVSMTERGARANESLEIIRRLWEGETLSFRGKYFQLDRLKLMPRPAQSPRPAIWVGGHDRFAIRRAARYGDGFIAGNFLADRKIHNTYMEELLACGKDPSSGRLASGMGWFIVSNDPGKTFEEVSPHVMWWVNFYADWGVGAGTPNPHVKSSKDLKDRGILRVVTPDEAVRIITDATQEAPIECVNIKMLPPGYPIEKMMPNIELFAKEVIPRFR